MTPPTTQDIELKPVRPLNASSRVLVVGANGQVGRAWHGLLAAHRIAHHVVDFPEIDLADAASVASVVGAGFTHVVNCAAWTDVDGAEADEAGATAINATGVGVLADACRAKGAHLLHYSTDYVFDGSASAPYAIDADAAPVNAYGRSKLAGEEALKASGVAFTLIRTSWVYSPWGKNFVRTIADLAETRELLRVVDDQRGCPTSAEHLASTSLALLAGGRSGTWHVTDAGACSWYELASHVVELTGAACRVEPCTTAEFPRPAARPAYGVLDVSLTESTIGPLPHWRASVAGVLRRSPASRGALTEAPAPQETTA